jgi:hypothetical protein
MRELGDGSGDEDKDVNDEDEEEALYPMLWNYLT